MIARKALLVTALASVALAGCQSQGDVVVQQGVGITALRSACPAVGVPDYLGNITTFNPADARTADAMDVSAAITNVRSQCDDSGDKVRTAVRKDSDLDSPIVVDDQNRRDADSLTVLRGGNTVIAKRLGTVSLVFADDQPRAQASVSAGSLVDRAAATLPADIRERITRKRKGGDQDAAIDPLAEPEVRTAVARATFEQMIGFQLTEDQLKYNATR